jgi:hypothetical protein
LINASYGSAKEPILGAIANIVLADALATPVNHTFSPARQGLLGSTSVAEWEDRAANTGIPVGFYKIHTQFLRPNKDRKTYRMVLKISLPVLETVSNSTVSGIAPAPTVSYTPLAQMEFVIPERASLQARKDLRKMAFNMLNDTQIVNMIENLDVPY